MKVLNPTFLTIVLGAKLILGSLVFCFMEADTLFSTREAVASDQQKEVVPAKAAAENTENSESVSMDSLLKKNADLERREKELEKRRTELTALQEEINSKIAKLEQLRNEIRSHVESKRDFEEQKLKHLVKAYSAMKPQAAATVVEKLDLGFAVEILSRMQGDTVGGILSFVDKEKAAKISESLAKRK
jgi:flagellar motility protein MotE (MotC chaperone)